MSEDRRVFDRLLAALRERVHESVRDPNDCTEEIALLHDLLQRPLAEKSVEAAATPATKKWLEKSVSDAARSDPDRNLVDALLEASPRLRWITPYATGDGADELFFGYTATQLIGPDIKMRDYQAPFRHPGDLALWFSLQAPRILYPSHRHRAPEVYLVLAGNAMWQQGDRIWRSRRPGEWIFHASQEGHAMQTRAEPLLSMAAWTDHLHAPMSVLDGSPKADRAAGRGPAIDGCRE